MAVWNGEAFLRQAIKSILDQTFASFECLIINDASTDQTQRIIDSFSDERIRCYQNSENIGLTKSLNKGLAMARGKYVARLDADDVAHPQRLEEQYALMKDSRFVLVGSAVNVIDKLGTRVGIKRFPTDQLLLKYELLYNNPFVHSSIFFLREDIIRCGGYDETCRYAQDYELYTRLALTRALSNHDQALVDYRVHAQSIGKTPETKARQDENRIRIMHAYVNHFSAETIDDIRGLHSALETSKVPVKTCVKAFRTHKRILRGFLREIGSDDAPSPSVRAVRAAYRLKRWLLLKNLLKHLLSYVVSR